jgi:hypothetical protein
LQTTVLTAFPRFQKEKPVETNLVGTLSKAEPIHKVEGGYLGLPPMNEPGTSPQSAIPFTTPRARS